MSSFAELAIECAQQARKVACAIETLEIESVRQEGTPLGRAMLVALEESRGEAARLAEASALFLALSPHEAIFRLVLAPPAKRVG